MAPPAETPAWRLAAEAGVWQEGGGGAAADAESLTPKPGILHLAQ